MNDQRPYGILKRKEKESSLPPAKRPPWTTAPASTPMKPATGSKMTSSNKLLAGYMAYEFLTKGTVLGHGYDTDRCGTSEKTTAVNGDESYEQVTSLLMMKTEGGDRVSGVVNPTELLRWIEM